MTLMQTPKRAPTPCRSERVSARPTIADIKSAAQARIFDVLAALGVRERPTRAGYISLRSPVTKDRHPSFAIWTAGPAAGAWKDHRDDGPGGTRGDLIDLVSYLSGWWNLPGKGRGEALRWLINLLELGRIDPARLRADRERSRKEHLEHMKARDEELARQRSRAFAVWLEGKPIGGTPVEAYLRSRAIELERLPAGPRGGDHRPTILRCLWSHRHTETKTNWPCMVAGCVDQAGEIRAIHRTWLRRDGQGKAPVEPVKKVWPAYSGLVVPIWRGESFHSIAQANADAEEHGVFETLTLTEGVEDALTAALAAPKYRTWAFIALSNLANVVLPRCVDSVILHRQTEWGKHTAVATFDRGKAALERQGRAVVEVRA
jgi:hypothetical protein